MNPPSRTPSRASTASQNTTSGNTQHAALSGATKAFGRPQLQQRGSSTVNGAIAAAATAGTSPRQQYGPRRSPAPPLVPSSTGGSMRSVMSDAPVLRAQGAPNLRPPPQYRSKRSTSPSYQAASLAASRAKQPAPSGTKNASSDAGTVRRAAPRPAAPPKPRSLSEHHGEALSEKATDDSPIPPTTSLVNLFERRADLSHASGKKPEPIVVKPGPGLALKSPQPIRSSGGLTSMSMFQMDLPEPRSELNQKKKTNPSQDSNSSRESFASASEVPTVANSPETLPYRSGAILPRPQSQNARPLSRQGPPSPPPKRTTTANPIAIQKPPPRAVLSMSHSLSPSSASIRSLPAQYNQLHPRGRTPQLTSNHLANAMVASSLASSRGASPQRGLEPPAPPTRRKHHAFPFSRTPSPTKTGGMRHTMRKEETESSSEDEDPLHPYGKHKKKRMLRKHPNKHREGERKRWREAVTERERKRYEGVWAANKGIYCSFAASEEVLAKKRPESSEVRSLQAAMNDEVSNLVARGIWSRSRLPEATLETIWDLVDEAGVGRLGKQEFVVGMWLLDQALKGRKIPGRVSESVWASVRGLQGIKIKK